MLADMMSEGYRGRNGQDRVLHGRSSEVVGLLVVASRHQNLEGGLVAVAIAGVGGQMERQTVVDEFAGLRMQVDPTGRQDGCRGSWPF